MKYEEIRQRREEHLKRMKDINDTFTAILAIILAAILTLPWLL